MRGCGERQPDSIYFESRLSFDGLPIDHFIIDPPTDCERQGIKYCRSYSIIERDGVNHFIDWVGENFYESPWDFIEECRLKGMSRRVSKTFDFTKVTPGKSQIFFAHKKAIDLTTKTKIHLVKKNRFEPHRYNENVSDKDRGKYGYRKVGDVEYDIKEWNPNIPIRNKDFRSGLFLRMPITNIVYVRPSDKKMLKKIADKGLNIEITEE